jgi:Tol biopolymer transport system component
MMPSVALKSCQLWPGGGRFLGLVFTLPVCQPFNQSACKPVESEAQIMIVKSIPAAARRVAVHIIFFSAMIGRAPAAGPETKGLYQLNADGTKLHLVLQMVDDEAITSPQQSPDGKTIAYDSSKIFNNAGQPDLASDHIFVVPSEGGKPTDLGPGMLPSWSPDSKQLCFAVAPQAPDGTKPGLYVMNADGTGRQWLFDAAAGRWSPDGGRLAFLANGDVHVYDMLAGTTIHLTNESRNITGTPAWSPEGKQIAIVYFSNADHSLAVLDAEKESQQPRVLWEGHGISRSPNWAPSKSILVFASPNQDYDFYTLDPAAGAAPMRPFQGKVVLFRAKDPTWLSDGQGILFLKPQ